MSSTHYRATITAFVLTAIPVCFTHAQQQPQALDEPPPQTAEQAPQEFVPEPEQAGVRERPHHVVLHVEVPGAHLEEGQLVRIIGPIDPTGDYIVMPIGAGPEAETRWLASTYVARPVKDTNYFVLTDVIARDSNEHEDETDHVMIMAIHETDENGPERVEFWTNPHEGSFGIHGGSAHLTIR